MRYVHYTNSRVKLSVGFMEIVLSELEILQNGLYLYWINLYPEPQPQQVNTRL